MKVVAVSLEGEIIVAEKVSEKFGNTMVHLWNENMYWNHKSPYHMHLVDEPIKGAKIK